MSEWQKGRKRVVRNVSLWSGFLGGKVEIDRISKWAYSSLEWFVINLNIT
jgi:hypothetical protein